MPQFPHQQHCCATCLWVGGRAQAFVFQATGSLVTTPPDRRFPWLQHGTVLQTFGHMKSSSLAVTLGWLLVQSGHLKPILFLSPTLEESPIQPSPRHHAPSMGQARPGTQAGILTQRPEREGGPCSTRDAQAPGLSDFCRSHSQDSDPSALANKFCFSCRPRAPPTVHLPPQEPGVLETGFQPCNSRGPAGE